MVLTIGQIRDPSNTIRLQTLGHISLHSSKVNTADSGGGDYLITNRKLNHSYFHGCVPISSLCDFTHIRYPN